jgi:hypothetical protein
MRDLGSRGTGGFDDCGVWEIGLAHFAGGELSMVEERTAGTLLLRFWLRCFSTLCL